MITSAFGGELVWSFVSQFEVTEGVVVVAAVLLLVAWIERLGFGSVFDHRVFKEHLEYPLSRVYTALAALGAICFGILVLCNLRWLNQILDLNGLDIVQYPLGILGHLGGSAMGQNGRLGYGALALLVWCLTTAGLSLGKGFVKALRLFALPSIVYLTVVVLLFDPSEMDSQAINLVSGFTFQGISLLSNWFLLTVSLSLTAFIACRGLWRRPARSPGWVSRLRRTAGLAAPRHRSSKQEKTSGES